MRGMASGTNHKFNLKTTIKRLNKMGLISRLPLGSRHNSIVILKESIKRDEEILTKLKNMIL